MYQKSLYISIINFNTLYVNEYLGISIRYVRYTREVILRSDVVIYTVANRFRNFARTCPIAFFSSRDHPPRIRELRSQSRPFIACGNRYSTHRILSLSIDTVSFDSRRIYTCLAERCIDCRALLCEFAQTDWSPAFSRFAHGDALRRAEEAAKMEAGLRGWN